MQIKIIVNDLHNWITLMDKHSCNKLQLSNKKEQTTNTQQHG